MGHAKRFLAAFSVGFVLLGSVLTIDLVTAIPAQANVVDQCDADELNSDDRTIPTEPNGTQGKRCIAGYELNTRGYLKYPCIYADIEEFDVYTEHECGSSGRGVEAIAQARLINNLNKGWDYFLNGGVDPRIQWELIQAREETGPGGGPVDGGRPDLVLYNYDQPDAPLHIYEVKRWQNPSAQNTQAQVDRYSTWWRARDVDAVAGAWAGIDQYGTNEEGAPTGYSDHFVLETDEGDCELYGVQSADRENITAGGAGAVWVDELGDSDECSWWDSLERFITRPLFPLPAPYTGADALEDVFGFASTTTGGVRGDPHLITLDGTGYDVQAAGEFVLVDSPAIGGQVQARFEPLDDRTSVMTAVSMNVSGQRVELRPGTTTPLLIDGAVVNLPETTRLQLGSGSYLGHDADGRWLIKWPSVTPDDAPVAVIGSRGSLELHLPSGSTSQGLLGDLNGDPADDLRYPDGSPLLSANSPAEVNGPFANSWRVTSASSLFTYGPGEDTGTHTDFDHPVSGVPATLDDYSATDRAAAQARCGALGLPVGYAEDSCVLDLLVAGDERFLESHATALRPAMVYGVANPGADGLLTANFDQAEPQNVAPSRRTEDPSGVSFAGPFLSSDTYAPYTYGPVHETYELSFDLMALGAWGSNGTAQSVEIRYGPEPGDLWTASFIEDGSGSLTTNSADVASPSRTGTLDDGTAYTVFPVSITVPDSAGSGVSFHFGNMNSNNGILAGLDNLTFAFPVQDPELFDARGAFNSGGSLTVPGDSLGAGSGVLEAVNSADVYTFTTTETAPLRVDWGSGPGGYPLVSWALREAGGTEVVAGGRTSWDASIDPLLPGTYEFVVSVQDVQGIGAYEFELFPVPEPDIGTLPLVAGTTTHVSDGVPFDGAGNLETTVSTDIYNFSVPSGTEGVYIDWHSAPGGGIYAFWEVRDANQAVIRSGVGMSWDEQFPGLAAGDYSLTVSPFGEVVGAYDFDLLAMTTDSSATGFPFDVRENIPESGSGSLETPASADEYVFTVPASVTDMQISWGTGPGGNPLVNWSVIKADSGTEVAGGWTTSNTIVSNVAPGSYLLRVSPYDDQALGSYSVSLQDATAQAFQVSLPGAVIPDSPAVGSGRLENASSRDTYRFTVPGGVTGVYLDWRGIPDGLGQASWSIVERSSGTEVLSGVQVGESFDVQTPDIAAGEYELHVSSFYNYTGPYAFNLLPVTADSGVTTLPVQVSPGVPFAGAGNLADPANSDTYTFTTAAAGSLFVDWVTGPSNGGGLVKWRLLDMAAGNVVTDQIYASDQTVADIPAGTYRLEVRPYDAGRTGDYALNLSLSPTPQVFAIAIPASVSDGLPASGAGNLETVQSKDVYTFTVPAGGQSILMDWISGPGGGYYAGWRLVNTDTNTQLRSGDIAIRSYSPTFDNLAAGNYRLEVMKSAYSSDSGAYQFDLIPVTLDAANVTLPAQIRPGGPFVGSGNLANPANSDAYTFTTTATGSLLIDWISSPGGQTLVNWKVVDASSGNVVTDGISAADKTVADMPPGTYRLEVHPYDPGRTGDYALDISVSAAVPGGAVVLAPGAVTYTADGWNVELSCRNVACTDQRVTAIAPTGSAASTQLNYFSFTPSTDPTLIAGWPTNLSANQMWWQSLGASTEVGLTGGRWTRDTTTDRNERWYIITTPAPSWSGTVRVLAVWDTMG